MDTLFDFATKNMAPLADRMRPTTLDEFVGQEHIVGENMLLRRAIKAGTLGSCIFYGGPGCGKTTLANIIANTTKSDFIKLNAVSSGVQDAKKAIDDATRNLQLYGRKTYLLLDECHRWNKAQSDCVLEAIEKGNIIFIGSTTENPFASMTKAIVSRCRVFEFKKIEDKDIIKLLKRALQDKTKGLGNYDVEIEEDALKHIAFAAAGDARNALNSLELAVLSTDPSKDGKIHITLEVAQQSSQKQVLSIDESEYYDMISAFIKSMRGSDADAAVYWAERLIDSGCDPLLVARRIIIHSVEDVGLADPRALVVATSAMTAFQNIGLPEGKKILLEAAIYVAEAPKSPSVEFAEAKAEDLVRNHPNGPVPIYLQDPNYKLEKVSGYKYPHSFGGWVEQQYLPDNIKDEVIYEPSQNGEEKYLLRAKIMKKNKVENKKRED
ncbi:MAG: replication-associated recombination protein A [Clostridiales bacterium]|nr:replication-associated recombination protein A [Clostridiales bacterium]